MKAVVGAFLFLFAAASFCKPDFTFPAKNRYALIGGGFSGFLAGLIGTGGALRGAFLTAFGLEKRVYIATAAVIALAVDVTRIPIYFVSGFLWGRGIIGMSLFCLWLRLPDRSLGGVLSA